MQHLQPNTTLQGGKYRIERVLGQGGFGITYLATQVSLNRRVAIKELFKGGEGQAINERRGNQVIVTNAANQQSFIQLKEKFKKEALRLAQLNHPNLVKVHEFFEENGTAYYVMDYIEGESLRTKLNRGGRLSEDIVLKYIQQLLPALETAHKQSIWHLDIKPENIMVDKNGNAYLIDFGASKHIEQNRTLTTSLMLAYTPGFCPPEQTDLLYESEDGYIEALKDIGPWTDIYSLGATMYNLLTDSTPPTAKRIERNGRNAFSFPNNVSSSTIDLIIWMMKPKREERPQSVSTLLHRMAGNHEDRSSKGNTKVSSSQENERNKNFFDVIYYVCAAAVFILGLHLFGIIHLDDIYHHFDKSSDKFLRIANRYDEVGHVSEGMVFVKKGYLYGFINTEGKEIVPCNYRYLSSFSEGMAVARKDNKYGYIDKSGNEIIKCQYDEAKPYHGGFALVAKGNKWGVINQKGEQIVPCKYDDIGGGLLGIFGGNIYSEGLAMVGINGKKGFVDISGREVIPCVLEEAHPFHDGLALIRQNGKYGYINQSGRVVIPCKYNSAESFSEGLARVSLDSKYGFINTYGNIVIPFDYYYLEIDTSFSDGLVKIQSNGKYGFIDRNNRVVIQCIYDRASQFSEGLAAVQMGGKYGYIDKTSNVIIPFGYDMAWAFAGESALVEMEGKKGMINNKGDVIIPFQFESIITGEDGYARIEMNGKYGLFDVKTGKKSFDF